MTGDVLEHQADTVARHIRAGSEHQRSMIRILRGDTPVAGPGEVLVMPDPPPGPIATAPPVDPTPPTLNRDPWVPAPEIVSTGPVAPDPFQEFFTPTLRAPAGPFDDIIAAMGAPLEARAALNRPLPPPSRFRMRVASVSGPHRATKRNYNYFEELNDALSRISDKSRSNDPVDPVQEDD